MKKWLMIFCLTVLMLLASGSETVLANANEYVSNINVNTTYTGQLLKYSEVEKYNFSLSSAGMVNVTFQHTNLYDAKNYWILRLYNSEQEYMLDVDIMGTDTNVTSANVGLPAGDYYIEIVSVKGFNGGWSGAYSDEIYKFKINYIQSSVCETEDNEDYQNADEILINTAYNGTNSLASDRDMYRFEIAHAGVVSLNFQHANLYDTERYWMVRLYNENTEQLLRLDVFGTDINIISKQIGLSAGTYYVEILSDDCFVSGYGNYSDETYMLKVNYVESLVWETEKNDSFVTADIINTNIEYNAANQTYDDLDFYKFVITREGKYTINFQHQNLKNTAIYWIIHLYDSATNELTELEIKGTSKNTNSISVYLKKGTYYLRINSSDYESFYGGTYSSKSYKFKVAYTFTTKKTTVKTSSVDYNKIKLSWKKIGDVDGYVVYRSTSKNGAYKAIKTIKGRTKCTYTDKSVKTGKTYYYKVRGYKKISKTTYYSKYSSALKVKAIPAKASIKSLKAGTRSAIITWKKQSGVSGYEVYMSTKKSSGYKKITTVKKASKVEFTKSKLKEGKKYYFKLRAYKVVNGKKVYGKYSSVKAVRIVWR